MSIPPPLVPGQPNSQDPDRLMIPFKLADAPRLQLEFLARSKSIGEPQRIAISSWLSDYNRHLVNWIHSAYGPTGVKAADELSRATANRMNENANAEQRRAERDLFSSLEEQMGMDDE
jgi:hypothetical protein